MCRRPERMEARHRRRRRGIADPWWTTVVVVRPCRSSSVSVHSLSRCFACFVAAGQCRVSAGVWLTQQVLKKKGDATEPFPPWPRVRRCLPSLVVLHSETGCLARRPSRRFRACAAKLIDQKGDKLSLGPSYDDALLPVRNSHGEHHSLRTLAHFAQAARVVGRVRG